MPPYKLARLTDAQMMKIEALENELGVTLVAYEPAATAVRDAGAQGFAETEAQSDLVTDALLDTYR